MLCFLDYFKYVDITPSEHVLSMLSNNAYRIKSLAIMDTKIEITAIGDPT